MRGILLIIISMAIFSCFASAAWMGKVDVQKVYVGQYVSFAVSTPPADTCSLYGRHFKFDGTTVAGKNLLSILLAAEMASKNVDLWYVASGMPNTDHNNGCNSDNLAVVSSIGFSD